MGNKASKAFDPESQHILVKPTIKFYIVFGILFFSTLVYLGSLTFLVGAIVLILLHTCIPVLKLVNLVILLQFPICSFFLCYSDLFKTLKSEKIPKVRNHDTCYGNIYLQLFMFTAFQPK